MGSSHEEHACASDPRRRPYPFCSFQPPLDPPEPPPLKTLGFAAATLMLPNATVPTAPPRLVRCSSNSTRAKGSALPLGVDFCQPEVKNLRLPPFRHRDVRWLDVAVNDSLGMGGAKASAIWMPTSNTSSISRGWPAIMCRRIRPEARSTPISRARSKSGSASFH
jgi:hypothetical protein